jgi:ADP-ribosyl-[dinitrogen reductase] hydrolase
MAAMTDCDFDMVADRALGAFIGLAVGDALGTTIEFSRRDTYEHVTDMVGGGPFGLKPGEWTDDTSMALCLADSLIAGRGELDSLDLASRFVRWWRQGENSVTGRCFDIGNTTRDALAKFEAGGVARGPDFPHSAGNGGIMRLAPAVIAAGGDEARAVHLAQAQSAVTHAADECLHAAAMMARMLNRAIASGRFEPLAPQDLPRGVSQRLQDAALGLVGSWPRDSVYSGGYVVETFEASIWSVMTSGSFAEAVLKAVNLGYDADTTGAVAGQFAGAVWGFSAIPRSWRARLAWHDRLADSGRALWALSGIAPDH